MTDLRATNQYCKVILSTLTFDKIHPGLKFAPVSFVFRIVKIINYAICLDCFKSMAQYFSLFNLITYGVGGGL